MPLYPFLGEGSPTKIDYSTPKKGTLILTSLLEDLDEASVGLAKKRAQPHGSWLTSPAHPSPMKSNVYCLAVKYMPFVHSPWFSWLRTQAFWVHLPEGYLGGSQPCA